MGRDIDVFDIKPEDREKFTARLYECLEALKVTIKKPGFGEGPITLGAELESCIVDKKVNVAPINMELLSDLNDPLFQHEINKFNLEYNLPFVPAKGTPFSIMQEDAEKGFKKGSDAAKARESDLILIGILPTLKQSNFEQEYMTDVGRYHMLNRELKKFRGGPFKVNINGVDPLKMECEHVTLEGANTSFQVHMRIEPDKFTDTYNAAQLMTPLSVALAANSPLCMGQRLWQESRIALFRHSIDSRQIDHVRWRQPSRVSFGSGWVRDDVYELFAESVALFPSIMPLIDEEKPFETLAEGRLPKLRELQLHMGTTWPWNRAVYSSSKEGHLRIEFRSLPAGPSIMDMMANAAYSIGMTMGLRDNIKDLLPAISFGYCEYNFYRAAQSGLDARIIWPKHHQSEPKEQNIIDVIKSTIPIMEKGLSILDIDDQEIQKYRSNIESRLETRMNGANWQLMILEKLLELGLSKPEACQEMTLNYIKEQQTGKPVAQWGTSV